MSFGDTQRLVCSATGAYLIGYVQSCRRSLSPLDWLEADFERPDSLDCLGSWEYEEASGQWMSSPSLVDLCPSIPDSEELPILGWVSAEDRNRFHDALRRAERSGDWVGSDHRLLLDGGGEIEVSSYLLQVGSASTAHTIGLVFSCKRQSHRAVSSSSGGRSELRRAEEAESLDESGFIKEIAGSLPETIYVSDMDEQRFSYRNRDFLSQLGYPSSLQGLGLLTLRDVIHASDQAAYDDHRRLLREDRSGEVFEVVCRMQTTSGEWRWYRLRNEVFRRDSTGQAVDIVGTIHDVTDQKTREIQLSEAVEQLQEVEFRLIERQARLEELNRQLAALATTDGLTGLYNYRAFHEKLSEEIRRARRYDDALSIVVADIDDFKAYNDEFGHVDGDERLRQFAEMLRRECREADYVARTGGEEFSFILTNTNAEEAGCFAQRLVTALSSETSSKPITASFGCAQLSSADRTKDDLVRRADESMYQAKRNGKNRVVVAKSRASSKPLG
ncbi:MAG: sensor domain-containing diguanylate cyclase [Fimbriimonas sp.]|nr:sensor domain-containing diguanylate cyclase [Fimbriimonas sp.]